MSNPTQRWPREYAQEIAEQLAAELRPACERIEIAGSIRRRRPDVGDIELVYIPRVGPGPTRDFFETPRPTDLSARALECLLARGLLAKRLNKNGGTSWGPQIKLAVHVPSGVPVDFFATSGQAWWSYLVCRTGPKESNIAIAQAAQRRGWGWQPFLGFRAEDETIFPRSEREVFDLVGLPYREPWLR